MGSQTGGGLMTFFLLLYWLLWGALPVLSQSNSSHTSRTRLGRSNDPHHERIIDCAGLAVGTRHVRSSVISSPDLKSSAYTETTAEQPKVGQCVNESRLYIKFEGQSNFRLVVLQSPEEQNLGNKFILIDWSADSRYVLFERMLFQYGSDAPPDIEPELYAVSGRYLRGVALNQIDKQWQERECLLYLRPAGFTLNGNVIIEEEIHPYIDPGDETPRDASCPNRTSLWEVPIEGVDVARQLPSNYNIPRFAKAEKVATRP